MLSANFLASTICDSFRFHTREHKCTYKQTIWVHRAQIVSAGRSLISSNQLYNLMDDCYAHWPMALYATPLQCANHDQNRIQNFILNQQFIYKQTKKKLKNFLIASAINFVSVRFFSRLWRRVRIFGPWEGHVCPTQCGGKDVLYI